MQYYQHPSPQSYHYPGSNGTSTSPSKPAEGSLYNTLSSGKITPGPLPKKSTSPPASWDPYQNSLIRQRSIPSFTHHASGTPPVQHWPSNSPHFHQNGALILTAPSIAASPTPSLSATQGQTNVRFSPTGHGHGAHGNAYMTNDNFPTPAAYSPIKRASPPPAHGGAPGLFQTPRAGSDGTGEVPTGCATSITGANAPTLSSPKTHEKIAGISPVKHDLPPSSPLQMPAQGTQYQREPLVNSTMLDKNDKDLRYLARPGSSFVAAPLALQPNIGLENGVGKALEPPVKRPLEPIIEMPPPMSQLHSAVPGPITDST